MTKPEQIREAIARGIEKFGRIDVLCNVAGILADNTLEEEDLQHMRLVMETNFFGAFSAMNAILPHFRENKNGTIVNCTSGSGLTPRLYGSAYCSSKHALEALTGVCWDETESFCRVMALEPGVFKETNIWNAKEYKNKVTIDAYKDAKEKVGVRIWGELSNDLGKAVSLVIDTVEQKKMPRRLILGKDACNRVRRELNYLKQDLKKSYKLSSRCSEIKRFKFFLRRAPGFPFRWLSRLIKSKNS